jgi:nucleoside-diphosphate-sugar epimerase
VTRAVEKRVLITGATGFVGRETVDPLRNRGFDVHGVTSRVSPPSIDGVTWHHCDLLDPDAVSSLTTVARASHLLHFAWYTVHGKFYTAPENADWVEASMALLEGFAAAGGTRAVMAGTCAEYDWNAGVCTEMGTPLEPGTVYGVAKKELYGRFERYCRNHAISWAWGRIFFTFGPFEHPDRLVAAVIRALLGGHPARTSHGRQRRDYMYVRDVADGFAALLESPVEGAVNVAAGQAVALRELIEKIGEIIGRGDLLEIGALPARDNDVNLIVADATRLSEEVGWTPRHDIGTALQETVTWWRDHLENEEKIDQ